MAAALRLPEAGVVEHLMAYGVHFSLQCDDPDLLQALRARLPRATRPATASKPERQYRIGVEGGDDGRFRVTIGTRTVPVLLSTSQVVELLAGDIQLHVAEHARARVFVHAGAVAYDGRGIILPGRSYAGKSTLTAALLRAGATYYSDEYAVLDRHGRLHPYPRALAMREGTTSRQTEREASFFGAITGRRPIPVGLVAAVHYREGAGWSPRRLSPGEGVLELLANTVCARSAPQRALATLAEVAAAAPVLQGERGDADRTARGLLDILLKEM